MEIGVKDQEGGIGFYKVIRPHEVKGTHIIPRFLIIGFISGGEDEFFVLGKFKTEERRNEVLKQVNQQIISSGLYLDNRYDWQNNTVEVRRYPSTFIMPQE